MSAYGDRKRAFARNFGALLNCAHALGYEVGFPPEHMNHIRGSLHFQGLAKDINLYKDGIYLRKTEDHLPLGLIWESLGGTWGGRFRKKDGLHQE